MSVSMVSVEHFNTTKLKLFGAMKAQQNNYIYSAPLYKNSKDMSEGYDCLRFPMRMCRWAGYFPVEGLHDITVSGLRYNLRGFYGVYYLATLVTGSITTFLILTWLLENDLTLTLISEFIFSTTGFFGMILMADLAKQWPTFMKTVVKIENELKEIRTSRNTYKYCNIMAACVMFAALVEHILSVINGFHFTTQCLTHSNDYENVLKEFFILNAAFYFKRFNYNVVLGIIFKVVNIQITFLWSFTDVLIICFSIYLISYFQDLNKVIFNKQNQLSWEKLRAHYSRVAQLVILVNERLSTIILQSYITYIFYICIQLFHTLKTSQSKLIFCDKDVVDKIRQSPEYLTYYVFSFLFLVSRFVITSLLAANVSLVARRPLKVLNAVSSSEYSLEVQRFRMQIEYTPVAMSGQFFYVTRPMLLQVVGSIITYELVMLQLH